MFILSFNYFYSFLYFLVAVFLAFYIPGNIFVRYTSFPNVWQKTQLSITLGLVLWALQGFLFGYLHLRFLIYGYLLVTTLFWIYVQRKNYSSFPKFSFPTKKTLLFSLFLLFVICMQLATTISNGLTFSNGIFFCCGLPDTYFHGALTYELLSNFPPHEPGLSNIFLQNYHFLPNLVSADLIRIFHLPFLLVQYPYMTILITTLFVLNVASFGQLLVKKLLYTYLLVFFVFFSGDVLFLLTLITTHQIKFDTAFLHNSAWMWISPPRVYGAMLSYGGLNFLVLYLQQRKNNTTFWVSAIIFGSLIGFKVYFGIFALVGYGCLFLYGAYKRTFSALLPIFTAFCISILLFLPINSTAGGFIFTGFWRFEDFTTNKIFGLGQMELARYVYLNHKSWLRVWSYDIYYIFLYFIFIFNTLLLACIQTKKSLKIFPIKLHVFLLSGLLVSFMFGSFFIQKTGGANSSQFLITCIIILPIYTAIAVFTLLEKIHRPIIKYAVVLLIVGLTIPRVVNETGHLVYLQMYQKGLVLDKSDLNAMEYLKDNTNKNSVVLLDTTKDCAGMLFFSQRYPYICTDGAPSDRGVDISKRLKLQEVVFSIQKKGNIVFLPKLSGIDYLYMRKSTYQREKTRFMNKQFLLKYQNAKIVILQILKRS